MITLLEVFDELFRDLRFDAKLAKKAYQYQIEFVNKNSEHMAFFGGNLMGVHRVRFTEADYDRYFSEVLGIESDEVEKAIDRVDTINHEFKVSSDALNLTWMYMIHRFLKSPYLNNTTKERAAIDIALVFNFRTIAALLVTWFKYPIDTQTAQAVYERLSGRYLIKKLGTWEKVFLYRAEEFTGKQSIHRKALEAFRDDNAIVNAINDLYGRTKDTLKNIYAEFIKIHESGVKITSSSETIINADGEEIIKDRVHGLENYQQYLIETMSDRNSFVKGELIDIVVKVVPTVQEKPLLRLLDWIPAHITGPHRGLILNTAETALVLAYNYLLKHQYVLRQSRDLIQLTSRLKGYILSSREESEDLEGYRVMSRDLVILATSKSSEQTIAALRNSLFLYMCLRAFTKHSFVGH